MGKKLREIKTIIKDYFNNGYSQRDNANMITHVSGLLNWVTQEIMRETTLEAYGKIAPKAVKLHNNGALHIHDLWLSKYTPYCSGFNLQDIILDGLFLAKRAGPAKRLDSILNQLINFIVSASQEIAGATAFSNFDTFLAPFIKKEDLSYKKVKQEIQSFFFNVNQPSRYGWQSVFLNLNVDIIPPKYLLDRAIIIGEELMPFTYEECKSQMDLINRAICEMHIKGDYNRQPFTFPIITVQVGKNFDWQDPICLEYMKLAALRGQPYFLNTNVPYIDEESSLSMCCRLNINYNDLKHHTGGIFTPGDATGSIGVVSLNMPRIGRIARNEEMIYERVDKLLDAARTQLIGKRLLVNESFKRGLLPTIAQHLKHGLERHFNTIGIVGMHDFCMNYFDPPLPIYNSTAQTLVRKILSYIGKKLEEFQREDKMLYNLEQTPAERTAGRFAYYDNQKFKGNTYIHIRNNGHLQYVNSTHLPPEFDNLSKKIEVEGDFQSFFTGGSVCHLFMNEISNNEGLVKFVKKICNNSDLGYFSITPTLTHCKKCKQVLIGNFPICPSCNDKTIIYSRITGYYTPVGAWNPSKQEEFYLRNQFKI